MNKICHHREPNVVRGFTLLEMVFVLGMIGIIVSWVTLTVGSVDAERKLREASGGIESLVRRARSIAVMQQRPYTVTISAHAVSMEPQYVQNDIEQFDDDDDTAPTDFKVLTATEEMDPDVKYEIRRWGSDLWVEIEGENKVQLVLDPTGLVEPISIRCSIGKSWMIQELHPLTGGVRYEEMSVQED